jgi:hypothetical protein
MRGKFKVGDILFSQIHPSFGKWEITRVGSNSYRCIKNGGEGKISFEHENIWTLDDPSIIDKVLNKYL